MNYQDLQEAKESFRLNSIQKSRRPYHKKREEFVKYFSISKIASMRIDEYVIGKGIKTHNFCYEIERTLDPLGRILGATSMKFGVFYSVDDGTYHFAKKYGNNYSDAFKNIKNWIIELLKAGQNEDYDTIIDNPMSTMLKGKILSTYYPNQFLNIFSEKHLNHYLVELDLDTIELKKKDPLYKRQALVNFKNNDKDMKNWSLDMFSVFLYSQYPKAPKDEEEGAVSVPNSEEIIFPTPNSYKYVELEIATASPNTKPARKIQSPIASPNYEKEAKIYKKLGDRGEKIVRMAEIDTIMRELKCDEKTAEKKVVWKSRESDSFGYDILSVNSDGSPKYIEVKATRGKVGDMFFYYTLNELEAAHKYDKDYFIYIVYDILTTQPKIWRIQNPFINNKLSMTPIQFKVEVNTK